MKLFWRPERILLLVVGAALALAVLLPLVEVVRKSLTDSSGQFVGLAQFRLFFHQSNLAAAWANSFTIAIGVTVLVLPPAFAYAFALTRSRIVGKAVFRGLAMAPLYAPTMLFGLALIFLFGRQGVVTTGFFGRYPHLSWDIGLYGRTGTLLGEALLAFPVAVMILTTALEHMDARLYEAACTLGSGPLRIFATVTLPAARYGIFNAAFAVFTLCFTDFGVPKVVGGNTPILATEIYKQVVGQQNFNLAAVVSLLLLLPVLVATAAERFFRVRQEAVITTRTRPYRPEPSLARDTVLGVLCWLMGGAILATLAVSAFASLVRVWPYRLELGLWHYRFQGTAAKGYTAFFNSLRLAIIASLVGTVVTFLTAYLVEKVRGGEWGRRLIHGMAVLPLALPGLVIGIAYIFFFNAPVLRYGVAIRNPFQALYGTPALIVISHIVHFFTIAYLTAVTALRQLDREFESASESLGVPMGRTILRVAVPLCLPSIVEMAVYLFVNAMATVSAVVFLRPPGYPLASVAVVNMEDAGDSSPAVAMSMLILLANLIARALGEITRRSLSRLQRWKRASVSAL